VIEMEKRMQGQEISLEPTSDDDERAATPITWLADASEGPSEHFERVETEMLETTGLQRALATLDDRSRRIVEARWLNEGSEKTLHDLAGEFGVSAERIRQIEVKAMQKMRTELKALR